MKKQENYQLALEAVEKAATQMSILTKQNKELRQCLSDIIFSEGKDLVKAKLLLNKQYNEKPEIFRGYNVEEQKELKRKLHKEISLPPPNVADNISLDRWFNDQDLTLRQAITNSPIGHIIKHRWKLLTIPEKQTYFTKYNKVVKA